MVLLLQIMAMCKIKICIAESKMTSLLMLISTASSKILFLIGTWRAT